MLQLVRLMSVSKENNLIVRNEISNLVNFKEKFYTVSDFKSVFLKRVRF